MIRTLDNNDIQNIMQIWLETNIIAHNFIDKSYWKNNFELVKNEYLPSSETYIFEDEKIRGFISIINKNFIGALFVDNNMQNKGIGTKLINYCKNKYNELSLSVYKENINAINFYKKNGFIIVKECFDINSNNKEYIMKWTK